MEMLQCRALGRAPLGPARTPQALLQLRRASSHRSSALRRRCPSSAQNRFISIQIAASWGNGPSSSAGGGGGGGDAAYADQPRFGAFSSSGNLGSGSSSSGGSSGSSSSGGGDAGSPITGLLAAVVDNVRAAPLPGAAAPWVGALMLPVVLWCATWVFTAGMFTLAQASLTGMSSVAGLLYPTVPLRGAAHEDIAVSLVKALQGGTDTAATWSRPGLLLPSWFVRWLMATMYGLAAASSSIAASLVNNTQLLAVLALSKGLLYANCLLFMLPLGSGFSSIASSIVQRLQGGGGGSDAGSGSSQAAARPPAFTTGSSVMGAAAGPSGGGSGSSGLPFSLPSLDDTTALALKLAGVLPWACISAAAVLQPALLQGAAAAPGGATLPLAISAPQVALCCAMLALMLTAAVAAGRFAWDLARRQGDGGAVVDFACQVGAVCGLQAALNAAQLGLGLAGRQLQWQALGIPLLSSLILARVAWSSWRLWRIEANAPSVWLQVLTVAPPPPPAAATAAGPGPAGGSGGGGSGGGPSGSSSSASSWRRDN